MQRRYSLNLTMLNLFLTITLLTFSARNSTRIDEGAAKHDQRRNDEEKKAKRGKLIIQHHDKGIQQPQRGNAGF